MPSEYSRTDRPRLPIKVILPRQARERSVQGGGSNQRPFCPVDTEFRERLGRQVRALRKAIAPVASKTGGVPARVRLHRLAMAKSHRPGNLFSSKTCPIIGAGSLGELFVKATPDGLDKIAAKIHSGDSQQIVKELSTVSTVEPVTPDVRRGGRTARDILQDCLRRPNGFLARVRLFDFGDGGEQGKVYKDFLRTCRLRETPVESVGYSETSFTYGVTCASVDDIEAIADTVGVRSISAMPSIRSVRPAAARLGPFPTNLPSPAEYGSDLPSVVVVDTGVSTGSSELNAWVVGRDSTVPRQYRNEHHGTFVAGLVAWGECLNTNIAGIDATPCTVFDLQVIPNGDPASGSTDSISESEFLQALETALEAHADRFKVWNLSLGLDRRCSLDQFSTFAVELDNLQEQYGVQFVVSAGNHFSPPLLPFPRRGSDIAAGRITSPADSLLGVSVGSIAHVGYPSDGLRDNDPSAFSRHGPGPNHIIKPDLIHFGGSCSRDARQSTGVRSVTESGVSEDCGTSFSAPLVARTLAHIFHRVTPTPSPVLARALLIHSARDPRTHDRVPDGEEQYFGFGLPVPIADCLECTPYSSTLVFEDTLRPGYYLEWGDFPYPPSLHRDGRYFGEIWMTLAFAPVRGGRWGAEYCQTRVSAHFGVYYDQVSRTSGRVTRRFKGLVPPEHNNRGVQYDSQSVASLRQWTPVRTYHGHLGQNGQRGEQWRLMVRSFTRHGVATQGTLRPQPFSLLVTIADPNQQVQVYDELSRIVRNRFNAQNLTIRPGIRERTRA